MVTTLLSFFFVCSDCFIEVEKIESILVMSYG